MFDAKPKKVDVTSRSCADTGRQLNEKIDPLPHVLSTTAKNDSGIRRKPQSPAHFNASGSSVTVAELGFEQPLWNDRRVLKIGQDGSRGRFHCVCTRFEF